MRFLKKILVSLFVYVGVFLPFVVIMQAVTGYDYTAAYSSVAGIGSVEIIIGCIIKREESKFDLKIQKKISEQAEILGGRNED